MPPTRSRKGRANLALVLVVGLAFFFLYHFAVFFNICRGFSARAVQNANASLALPVSPNEAIVVLTGDQKRIPRAVELLRERGSPLLIISGTAKKTTLTALVNQQGDAALRIHEIWKKIVLESHSASTIENALESGKILRAHHSKRVILVTSDYHMLRSSLIFKALVPGYEYILFPAASVLAEWHWWPSRTSLDALWHVLVEYLKLLLWQYYLSPTDIPPQPPH